MRDTCPKDLSSQCSAMYSAWLSNEYGNFRCFSVWHCASSSAEADSEKACNRKGRAGKIVLFFQTRARTREMSDLKIFSDCDLRVSEVTTLSKQDLSSRG